MKNLSIILSLACVFTFVVSNNLSAQTSGGPDNFGYIWKNSDDPEGPTFNWIDISTTGTEVTGLQDDNSVGFFPTGFDFRYYENTYYDFKVGSNGWISFNDVSNIGLCFPPVPTAGGGGDNIMFVFSGDFNHITATEPNNAKVYFQNIGTVESQVLVISFLNVPYWFNNSAGFLGSNSFQIIIESPGDSFIYQYLSIEPTVLNALEACTMNTSVGFENADGSDGLQILSNHNLPSDGMAIRIECPGCFTSVQTDKESKNSVYPNPVSDLLYLDVKNLISAKIFDEQGKLISEIRSGNTLSFSDLKSGIYNVQIISSSKSENFKIVKLQ